MPANVETMFYVREAPWHGSGNRVENALSYDDALMHAGWSGLDSYPKIDSNRRFLRNPGLQSKHPSIRSTDARCRYRSIQDCAEPRSICLCR